MTFIYVLKLKNDKYYIGEISNFAYNKYCVSLNATVNIKDIHKYFVGHLPWTDEHLPISIAEFKKRNTDINVNKVTIKYMYKYGIENVRGGKWKNTILTRHQIGVIKSKFCEIPEVGKNAVRAYAWHLNKDPYSLNVNNIKELSAGISGWYDHYKKYTPEIIEYCREHSSVKI